MLKEIQKFDKNALALELSETFTEADAVLIMHLFEEKLQEGHEHVNILIKVKDMSILKHMELKGFIKGEWWGIKHFSKIGRCAVVSHSGFIESVIKIENKLLHFLNPALEEKYFDESQMDEAIKFITPE
ncbi:MAG: STAS/SEC14 domain-containing protein [Chitinophagales bacterium]